jgi:PKHD-type hydroxylase
MVRSRGRVNDRINAAFNSSNDRARLLSPEECESVIGLAEADSSGWAREFKTGPIDASVFKAYSMFIIKKDSTDKNINWFPHRLRERATALNSQIWDFAIDDISDVFVLRYGVADQFQKHMDLGDGYLDRKLSMLVQLSAADSYEGGALQFGFAPPAVASREQGSLLVFPAWVPHQVTPITSGTRYTAGCFVLGPSFR